MDFWTTSDKRYNYNTPGTFAAIESPISSPTVIEEINTNLAGLFGPEAALFLDNGMLRIFYLFGSSGLSDGGQGKRKYLGIDFGLGAKYAFLYVGYRRASFSFSDLESDSIYNQVVSAAVWGGMLRTRYNKTGFNFSLDYDIGITFMLNVLKRKEEETLRDPGVAECELYFGYKFINPSINVRLGYGVWWCTKLAAEIPQERFYVYDNISHGFLISFAYELQ